VTIGVVMLSTHRPSVVARVRARLDAGDRPTADDVAAAILLDSSHP
jgi:hypothetical protein